MTEERTSSAPAAPAEGAETPATKPSSPPPSVRHRFQIGTDPGRVPAIPGLIAPRFVARSQGDSANPISPIGTSESPGLMRPQLPFRKQQPFVPPASDAAPSHEDDAPPESQNDSAELDDVATTARPAPPDDNREVPILASPPKPPQVVAAQQVPGPKRRVTPFPHPASTLTAMRIISIGLEDDPLLSELPTPMPEAPDAARQRALPDLDAPQLPNNGSPQVERGAPFDDAAFPDREVPTYAEKQPLFSSEPSFEAPQVGQAAPNQNVTLVSSEAAAAAEMRQGSSLEPLPSFDLSESTTDHQHQPLGNWSGLETASPRQHQVDTGDAPLPSFELPDTDEPPLAAAVERLPAFELPESPEPATEAVAPSAERAAKQVVPSAPPRSNPMSVEARVNSPSQNSPAAARMSPPPPAPVAEARPSPPPPPPPKPLRATAQPVVLSEADVAPDSVKPAPPAPPSRTGAVVAKPASEPIRAESSASPPRPVAAVTDTSASKLDAEASPQVSKRNPPRPPTRRSYPALGEAGAETPPGDSSRASSTQKNPPAASEATKEKSKSDDKAATKARRPWWEELFDEDFTRALSRLSDEQIKREATFIEESLGVAPGGVVLDLGCGAGYHAVELAQRGYAVVGYDLSLHQLALAAEVAQDRRQKLNLMQGDMRDMAFDSVFDGIYCWDTTFGYFEEEKNLAVAARIFQALKPGGTFLVDVVNRDFVTMHQPSNVWFEGDSAVCMDDMNVDFISSRLRVKRSLMLDDGRTRECVYSIRLYSLHELGKLLHEVGFRIAEASGQPATPGVFMWQNAQRIIILAQRP